MCECCAKAMENHFEETKGELKEGDRAKSHGRGGKFWPASTVTSKQADLTRLGCIENRIPGLRGALYVPRFDSWNKTRIYAINTNLALPTLFLQNMQTPVRLDGLSYLWRLEIRRLLKPHTMLRYKEHYESYDASDTSAQELRNVQRYRRP